MLMFVFTMAVIYGGVAYMFDWWPFPLTRFSYFKDDMEG
jgi:hypothetical protein